MSTVNRNAFSDIFPKQLGIFSPNFICLLHIPIYVGLQSFIQLSATFTKLCHIKRDHHNVLKMSTIDRNARWVSHLLWHNFVTVGDNWTKICILAHMWMFNRRVKFRLKIPNGKDVKKCVSVDWHFAHMMWTGWSRLIWHNFVKVADNWIKIRSLA